MWIADIDVPQSVLDAAENGNLVFFVGAGASRAAPSDLPDFQQLVRTIGSRAGHPPSVADLKQPDVFLGRLEDAGVNVHELVATAIDRPGSQANVLHTAIVRLAAAYPTPRIVTTNYDQHLTSAARDQSLGFPVYSAPALPVGDDFDGLVHLHGSLDQPSRRLVVTDIDFGVAYLREAWAARFLERVFSTSTVLFIGYSHGDVVMQYLARSLGPDGHRFVLTDDAENAEWRRLGLTTIHYPNDSEDHAALPISLERWAALVRMGQVEHRARIADIVSGDPPAIPEEISYIEAALRHPERINYFVEKARFGDTDRSHRWFGWIEAQTAFADLFSPAVAGRATSRKLMFWLAGEYIMKEARSGIVLRAFREKDWPPETWYSIAQQLLTHRGEVPTWLSPWLQLLVQNAPNQSQGLLDMMLVEKDWANNFDLALMLLENRTCPRVVRSLDFGSTADRPRFSVNLRGDEYWLTESWTKVFLPALGQHREQLLGLVTEQIARVYRSLRGLDPDFSFDPVAYSRSAIESHEQDRHRDPMDVLIDAARDCIEDALTNDVPLAERYLWGWSRSTDTILRRLCVHGWRVRSDLAADEKLRWLRDQDWLWDVSLRHEMFLLLGSAFSSASEGVARWFIDAAVTGPPNADHDERSLHKSFRLLAWLADSAPSLSIASTALDAFKTAHPEFRDEDHPDVNRNGSIGGVEDVLPYSAEELHELLAVDPNEALSLLRAFRSNRFASKGPTWESALGSLRACIAVYPEDGLLVAPVLPPEDEGFRSALIDGWDNATLHETLADRVLEVISSWDFDEIRRSASAMLSNGGKPEHPTTWHQFARARDLASDLWPASVEPGGVIGGADVVLEAINHPAGDLAEFWTKSVQWDWSTHQLDWEGIPEKLARELNRLIDATDRNGVLAQTVLASQLHFFFAADRAWCEKRLLPRFDWAAGADHASAAWQGFLTWGRWSDGLLQAGLLDGYVATAAYAGQLPGDLQRQFAGHLSSIALYAPDSPRRWLTSFIATAPEEVRVRWAHQVKAALVDMESDKTEEQWRRWIGEYWADRNLSIPLPFTEAEASATAGWVLGLPTRRTEAIDEVLRSRAALDHHARLLFQLDRLDLVPEANEWSRMLTHMFQNTSGQLWASERHLETIIRQLRQGVPPPDLGALVNELMRFGFTDAADW